MPARPFTVGVTFLTIKDNIILLDLALVSPYLLRVRLGPSSYTLAIFVYCGMLCRAVGEPSVEGGRLICLTRLTPVMSRPRSGPTRTSVSPGTRRKRSHSRPGGSKLCGGAHMSCCG